jgi:hypothetical protein
VRFSGGLVLAGEECPFDASRCFRRRVAKRLGLNQRVCSFLIYRTASSFGRASTEYADHSRDGRDSQEAFPRLVVPCVRLATG